MGNVEIQMTPKKYKKLPSMRITLCLYRIFKDDFSIEFGDSFQTTYPYITVSVNSQVDFIFQPSAEV